MKDVVIVGAMRTPIGDLLGSLKDVSAVDLGVAAVNGALKQANVDPSMVNEVACGMIYKAGVKGNPARQIQIKCGMPVEGYAYTVDQQCGSGMRYCCSCWNRKHVTGSLYIKRSQRRP